MTSQSQNRNHLGNSLKLSLESLKPLSHPFIYLSFVIMTILHIGFSVARQLSNQKNLEIIQKTNFKFLFSEADNYNILTKLSQLLQTYIYSLLTFGFVSVLVWAFVANMSYMDKGDWQSSLRYLFRRTLIKIVSLLFLLAIVCSLAFSLASTLGAGMVQMLAFTLMSLVPYYLLSISIPRKELASAMSLRFYFNALTISLFIYLLKAPVDILCDYLFMMDIGLGLPETSFYLESGLGIGLGTTIIRSVCYSLLWIAYAVWMGKISKLNRLFSSSDSLK